MVQVTVSEGILEGEVKNSIFGQYFSFKGIPYAQPPLGNLRFKAPIPPLPWEGVRTAKQFGPKCVQYNLAKAEVCGSEDCLYLNVFSPCINHVAPLPVMVWIHGGNFTFGGGDTGPEFLMRKGVILVTFTYRLGAIGFLCLNTKEIPGNAGPKDQVQALRWVNKNINNFGGDPNNVTIFGLSSGARCVSYHTISPLSNGLFKRAICQSGVSLGHFSQADKPRDRALALARKLGFYSENDQELYEFFKNQPIESLVNLRLPIYLSEKYSRQELYFTIVDEKDIGGDERFFYGDMLKAIANNIHEGVEIITGFTTDEGIIGMHTKKLFEKRIALVNDFPELFVTKTLKLNLPKSKHIEVGKKIKRFYFKDNFEATKAWQNHVKIFSMDMYVLDAIRWTKICASKTKNKIYMYMFSFKSDLNNVVRMMRLHSIIDSREVTSHGDDLQYLFLTSSHVITPFNFQLIDTLTALWTNFAKYGNPTPDDSFGVKWEPYTIEEQNYLNIGNILVLGNAPFNEEVQFWENLYKEYGQRLFD